MKYILAYFLIGVIAHSEVFAGEFPFECSKEQDAFYPHPEDCQAFYKCVSGTPQLHVCSKGLQYNPFRQQCDLKNRSGCQSGRYAADYPPFTGVIVPNPPKYVVCLSSNCLCMYPVGECEEFYYICKFNQVYKVQCAAGLKYNPNSLQCDHPENIKGCKDVCSIIRTPHACTCIRKYRVTDCLGVSERVCPRGTAFNTVTKQCDSQTFKENCNAPDTSGTCEGLDFPDPTDCRAYFTCTKGNLMYPKRCPAGTAFNKARRICDYASVLTECRDTTTRPPTPSTTRVTTPSTTRTTTSSTTPRTTVGVGGSSCPKYCIHDGHSAHPTHCRRFCHCSNGLNYEKKCPGATHWSPEFDRCESPGIAKCGLRYLWEE